MRKGLFFSVLVALVFAGMINFVIAEMLVSDVGVIYDSEIEKAFNSSEWVGVFFKLDDISKADNLISNLSDEEFQFIGKSPSRIVGKITKGGFNKLINDSRVKEIYYNFPVEGTNNKTEDENKIYSEKERDYQLYMWIILGGLLLIIFYIIIRKKKNNR